MLVINAILSYSLPKPSFRNYQHPNKNHPGRLNSRIFSVHYLVTAKLTIYPFIIQGNESMSALSQKVLDYLKIKACLHSYKI